MVTDKEMEEATSEHYKKIPWQYLTNISYPSVHENVFKAGAKWMQEKMKKDIECTWCGRIKKACDCTLTQEHYDNKDKI